MKRNPGAAGTSRTSRAPRPVPRGQRRASPLSRVACLAYVILLADASLYPFAGWRDPGVGPFDYLAAPWPARPLEFDIVVNVLGYLPFGLLCAFALYPVLRGWFGVLAASLSSAVLSAGLEAVQTYLPTRVASKVDLASNVVGATLGALLGLLLMEPILDRGRLREVRQQWFDRDASFGLVIATLWFGAILYPEPYAFALGNLGKTFGAGLAEPDLLGFLREPSARGFSLEELIVSGCFLAAAGLLLLNLLRASAPRVRLTFAFMALSALAKTLGTGWTYAPGEPFIWVTRGALESGIAAEIVLLAALYMPPRWRSRLAQLLLWSGLLLVNLLPENPYFEGAWQDWAHGRLLNFYGLALGISLAWPFVALLYLLRSGGRRPRDALPSV